MIADERGRVHYAGSDRQREPDPQERRLADVECPQCRKAFVLTWNDYSGSPATLNLRGCPSGGIYDVRICCPHCDYEEEL